MYESVYCTNLSTVTLCNISHVVSKPAFYIWENKSGDQLGSNPTADQQLCFHYIDGTSPLSHKSVISSLYPSYEYVAVQPDLCQTWLETSKTSFLMTSCISQFLCIDFDYSL